MVSKLRRTIAEEIVDQALNHFKKQQQLGLTGEGASVPEVERRPEESYEPSANFNKIFSGLIGEKSSADKNVRPEKSKIESSFKVNCPQNSSHNEPANYKLHEQQQEEGTQSSQIEKKRDEPPIASVSIFKKLSHGAS